MTATEERGVPLRLTVILTHPVQYYSPWFRYIAATRPELDLTVLYGAVPTPTQQGVGFGVPFEWDVPLTEGYRHFICGDSRGKRFDSDHLFGVDVPDLRDRIANTHPDVVLVPGWHSAMQWRALRACRRLGVPVLYRGDSTLDSGPRGWLRPGWVLKTRLMLRRFDAFLSVGADASRYLRRFGIADPLIVPSPHCVDNQRFEREATKLREPASRARLRRAVGAGESDFVVLFAGRFIARKRPLDAVRAVSGLGGSAVLVLAGDGPLAAETRAEAERLGVRVAWRGFLNQSELPAALAAADCLLVPSAWESWGLIVNEALASGVACVATSGVAAVRDLIEDGVTGYCCPPGDAPAMTAGLGEVRAAMQQGRDFAQACRARVAACSFAAATDGLVLAARRVVWRVRVDRPSPSGAPRVLALCSHMVMVFGVERMTFEVLRVLRARDAAVHCIVNRWDSARIVALAEEVGASWSHGYFWHSLRRTGWTPLALWRMATDVFRSSAGLIREAYRFRPTHVIAPDFVIVLRNWPALLLLRASGIRVVMKVGNAPEPTPFYRRLWRWVMDPAVGLFVANSRFTAAELTGAGVPARKVRAIYETAPMRKEAVPGPLTRDLGRVVYTGQMIPPKGLHVLLEAIALLVRRGHDVRLDAIGDIDGWAPDAWTSYRPSLRARAEQPDLQGRVRFLGVRDDVPALLAAAGVHCCPSQPEQREAFGLVNVEAKESGIPSVVTPSGALPELIEHRKDGWIATDSSAEALADGIEYFLADPDRLREAGRHALTSAARFSGERFATGWIGVFDGPHLGPVSTAGTDDSHAASAVERHVH